MPDSLPDPTPYVPANHAGDAPRDATGDPAGDERVLILDFGSQFTQLIARRLRESGVYCEIWPFNADPARIRAFNARAFILSGGPASVHEGESPRAPQMVFEQGVPVLGICYGQMVMCAQLGGETQGSDHREFGRAFVDVTGDCALLDGVWHPGAREQVWMSHGVLKMVFFEEVVLVLQEPEKRAIKIGQKTSSLFIWLKIAINRS